LVKYKVMMLITQWVVHVGEI